MLVVILTLQLSLVLACPPESPSGGDPPLQPSVDFPGGDLLVTPSPDEASCQILCTNHPDCDFFSYHSVDPGTGQRRFDCHLKTSEPGVPETRKPNSGVTSGFSLPKTPEYLTRCLAPSYDGVEFVGNVLSFGFVTSREECEASCTRNPGCQFYTYYPAGSTGQRCYLQFSTNFPSPPNITVTPGAQSGFSQRGCCTGDQCVSGCADLLFPHTLFSGRLISTCRTPDTQSCQQRCTQHPLCHFFTFSLHQSLWCECYLKSSESGLPENVTSEENMYSGFTKTPTQPGFLGCADLLVPGLDYSGLLVVDVEVDDVEQCRQLCTSYDRCQFFTLRPGDSHTASGMSICSLRRSPGNIPTAVRPLEAAVSGFSLQYNTLQKGSQNCSSVLYPELEFLGLDVMDTSSPDVENCRSSCTEHPDCKFFTFYWDPDIESYRCRMRTSAMGGPEDIFQATNATSGFSLKTTGPLDCSSLLFPNTSFTGDLIGYIMAPDVSHCQRLCTQNPPCQFFTHLSVDWTLDERRFFCFLQSGVRGAPDNVSYLPHAISGFSKPLSGVHHECVAVEYEDLNFPGSEERSLKTTSYRECQDICTQDSLCQFFTFFNRLGLLPDQLNTCYLKSLLSIPLPQIIKYSPGVTSGFPQRSCKGPASDSPPDVLPSC